MRAFFAVELPHPARRALAELQRTLAESSADVKWVNADQLHLTMRFLGDINDSQRAELEVAGQSVAASTPPFSLTVAELGAFPTVQSPRVIWTGIARGNHELARMAEALERAAMACGLPAESRRFAAHLTLGRVRSPRGLPQLIELLKTTPVPALAPIAVEQLTLMESRLSSGGSVYTPLGRWSLR